MLFFIARCLTISSEVKNRDNIELILKKKDFDWEALVKVSTSHYVFPAIYCNFKRANFLKYLPSDLVEYMIHITDLNRNRNIQIVRQAKKLNSLLLENGIRPIFLKGTGNLLEGLYEDLGERMVGDIDLLFSEKDFSRAIDILKNDNYTKPKAELDYFSGYRHYSRLVKERNIAAVEIHKEVIIEKYRNEINCKMISKDVQLINDFSVLSYQNQLSLSIISSQINDYGFELKNFPLRNAYDVFLLSKKVDTKKSILKFTKLKRPLNFFLAKCNLIFGEIDSLKFFKNRDVDIYLETFNDSFLKRSKEKVYLKSIIIKFKRRFLIVCKSLFNRKDRMWLLKRIKDSIN